MENQKENLPEKDLPGIIEFTPVSENRKLTRKEKCQADHAGQCGVCHEDGTFEPCI